MPDLTHDGPDDGFHEIHLSGKQLVFLFMATTVVSVVIFLCGVLVGRGVRAERGDAADTAIAGLAAPAGADAPVPDSGPPAAEPPSPPEDGELSYNKRLESDTPAREVLQRSPRDTPAQPAPRPAPPAASAPAAERSAGAAARGGTWVVQVHALRDRDVANDLVRRLSGKGYPAFLVNPAAGAPAIYRVQVGRFTERAEAEQVVLRLKKEEQFNSWVTR